VRSIKKAQQQQQQDAVDGDDATTGALREGGGAIASALRDAADATEQLAVAVERQLTLRDVSTEPSTAPAAAAAVDVA
jgi:hypothetical protein